MSKARKHIEYKLMEDLPVPSGTQEVVRVRGTHGTNLIEVENAKNETFLVLMPTKFRKLIWIKRGEFLIIETALDENHYKVKGSIEYVLQPHQIRYLKKQNLWPKEFEKDTLNKPMQQNNSDEDENEENEEEETDYFNMTNPNRVAPTFDDDSTTSSEDEDDN